MIIMNSKTTNNPMNPLKHTEAEKCNEDRQAYYGAFQSFDWNSSGKISHGSLLSAMRRAGANPTEVEVHDIINKLDDGTGHISFNEFYTVMMEKNEEIDQEINYKETFRVFSKDALGCISADEFKFVFKHLRVTGCNEYNNSSLTGIVYLFRSIKWRLRRCSALWTTMGTVKSATVSLGS